MQTFKNDIETLGAIVTSLGLCEHSMLTWAHALNDVRQELVKSGRATAETDARIRGFIANSFEYCNGLITAAVAHIDAKFQPWMIQHMATCQDEGIPMMVPCMNWLFRMSDEFRERWFMEMLASVAPDLVPTPVCSLLN